MAPIPVIDINLTRTGTPGAWQAFVANPLHLRASFTFSSGNNFDGAATLRCELHPARLVTNAAPLALATDESPSGLTTTFEFTAAQMNQSLGGLTNKAFWIVIFATYADADIATQIFRVGTLTLLAHPASLAAPVPPNEAGVLTEPAADLLYAALSTVEAQAVIIADLTARIEVLEAAAASPLTVDDTSITTDDSSITVDQTTL